jgi:tRNA threonylcarbamoyl adenosine modification protein YeaZ
MAEMIIGICTSGSRLKIAVSSGGRVFQAQKKEYNQERVLFALLERELKKAGGSLRSAGTVCAARGPGRFTGIRIALTLAGSLKAMAGAEVFTATSFEILALQAFETAHFRAWAVGNPGGRMAALLHAFKDEYFCQFFKTAGKLPRADGDPVWLKAEELKALLASAERFYAVGDSEECAEIYGLLPPGAAAAPKNVSRVLPAYIIKASLAYGSRTLKPLYLKPAKYELEHNVRPKAAR